RPPTTCSWSWRSSSCSRGSPSPLSTPTAWPARRSCASAWWCSSSSTPGRRRSSPCSACSIPGSTSASGPSRRLRRSRLERARDDLGIEATTTHGDVMELILREAVSTLGRRGDVVKVADGYARNFLLPRGLAMAVTAANKAMIEKERKAHAARMAKEKAEFETLAGRITGLRFIAPRKGGENDQLYGSVTS